MKFIPKDATAYNHPFLVSLSNKHVVLWSVEQFKHVLRIQLENGIEVQCLQFYPISHTRHEKPFVVIGGKGGVIKVFDLDSCGDEAEFKKNEITIQGVQNKIITSFDFVPENATIHKLPFLISSAGDGSVVLYNMNAEFSANDFTFSRTQLQFIAICVLFISDEKTAYNTPILAVGGTSKIINLYDLNENPMRCVASITGHHSSIRGLAFIPSTWTQTNEPVLVSCSKDCSVKFWKINRHIFETGLFELKSDAQNSFLLTRDFDSDLVVLEDSNHLTVLDLNEYKFKFRKSEVYFAQNLTIADEKDFLCVANFKQELLIMKNSDFSTYKKFMTNMNLISLVEILNSQSKLILAVGSQEGGLKLFDVNNGEVFVSFSQHFHQIVSIKCVEFGVRNLFVSGDNDGAVHFFDSEGKLTFTPTSNEDDKLEQLMTRKIGRQEYLVSIYQTGVRIATMVLSKLKKGMFLNYIIQEMNYHQGI